MITNPMKAFQGSVFFLVLLLTGCSSVQIFSDYDRTAEFTKYKSYAWLPSSDSVDDLQLNNALVEKNFKYYVNNEMKARGYTVDIHSPDLLFQYHTSIEKKQQIVNNPVYSNPTYRYNGAYRYNRPNPYNYYNNTPYITGYTTQVIDYNEETLVIDVIDRKQNQLIWRGWSVGTLQEGQNLEGRLEMDVKKILRKYPVSVPRRK